MYDISKKITELRKTAGVSQEQLAFDLDVSRQTVCRWEAGIRQPNAEKLNKLCRYFGVTADYFLADIAQPAITEEVAPAKVEEPAPKKFNITLWRVLLVFAIILCIASSVLLSVVCAFSFEYPGGAYAAIAVEGIWFLVFLSAVSLLSLLSIIFLILFKKRKCNRLGTKKLQTNGENCSTIDKKTR